MRVIETTVYQFDELSDKAKERARSWYREASAGDNYLAESVIDDAVRIGELIGVDIDTRPVPLHSGKTRLDPCVYWSGFWSQGDGASFTGTYSRKADAVKAVSEYAPTDEKLNAIVAAIDAAASAIAGEWRAVITQSDSRYSHEYTMQVDLDLQDDDETPAFKYVEQETALLDGFRAFAKWIYRQLESEYEYVNSDESVDETIRANEYEFKADGSRSCV